MSNNEEQTITAARKATLTQLIALGAKSRQHLIVHIALASYIAEHVLCSDNNLLQELLADAVMLLVAQRREQAQRAADSVETAVTA